MMAQLVPSSQGARERLLACGCCETRWKYKRIGCPFCRNEDSDLLEILTVEDEQKLRIDADTGLGHALELLAQERGLERRGKSLYQI